MYYEKRLNLFVLTLNNRGLGTGAFTLQFVKKPSFKICKKLRGVFCCMN